LILVDKTHLNSKSDLFVSYLSNSHVYFLNVTCPPSVIPLTSVMWSRYKKLQLGTHWFHICQYVEYVRWTGNTQSIMYNTCWEWSSRVSSVINSPIYIPSADKSLARPGRKQATATKL